jgi:hypothetical protein
MSLRIEVGDRVRSLPSYAKVAHEGTVQLIAIEDSTTLLGILIDRVDSKPVKPTTEESQASLWSKVETNENPSSESFQHLIKPFTSEMVEVYVQFQEEEDTDKKYELLLLLGNLFLQEADTVDTDLPEWVIEMAQEAIDAQAKAEAADDALRAKILRVGRMVVRNLREFGKVPNKTSILPKRVRSTLN